MKSGIRPGTENRYEFCRVCELKGLSLSAMLDYTKEMRGKTDEEKEEIAKKLIAQLRRLT